MVLIDANFEAGSLRKKKPTFPGAPTGFPPSSPSLHPLRHDIPGTRPEIPDQTSALVLIENLLHPSLFFLHFDNSCDDISTIHVNTLDLRLQRVLVRVPYLGLHQKQVERPPHIDVGYERAGPLQRSKEIVGLGDDSIMCVSSLRSKRLEVFG